METYTEFLSSASTLRAINKLLNENEDNNKKSYFLERQANSMREVNDSYKKISIVSSKNVYLLVKNLYLCAMKGKNAKQEIPSNIEFDVLENALVAGIREELKIDI